MSGRRTHYGSQNHFERGSLPISKNSIGKTMKELREMGAHVVQAAKDALRQGAETIVQDAKSRCPVKTGKLRDSIHAVSKKGGAEYALVADAVTTVKKRLRNIDGTVMTDSKGMPVTESMELYYGQIVEFSPEINHPFLYPAMEAHSKEIMDNVKDAISAAINRGK